MTHREDTGKMPMLLFASAGWDIKRFNRGPAKRGPLLLSFKNYEFPRQLFGGLKPKGSLGGILIKWRLRDTVEAFDLPSRVLRHFTARRFAPIPL